MTLSGGAVSPGCSEMVLCAPDPGAEEVVEMLKTRGSMMDSEIPLPLIDLRTQESVGSGGVRQKLVCSGRRTEERYRVDGMDQQTTDTVSGSRDGNRETDTLTRSGSK